MANLAILTAEQLQALNSLERQVARRAARQQPLVRLILQIFLRDGGPIPVADITKTAPDGEVELVTFDDEDIIRVRAGQIDLAYPFSALPTPFLVRLPRGRQRYACCATDALGFASMVDEPVEIESSCHHCGHPLKFTVTPNGVGSEAEGVMVWFGKGDEGCKAFDSL